MTEFPPGHVYRVGDNFLGGTIVSAVKFYPRLGLPKPLAEAEHQRLIAQYEADPRWERA